jgi:hypothetical protein
MPTVEEAALIYTARGWSVFPVGGNKKPLVASWEPFQSRLASETEIHAWYSRHRNAGIAIATGRLSGLVVLDIDVKSGGEKTLKQLIKDGVLKQSDLETSSVTTQSGGKHYFFRYPEDVGGDRVPNAIGLWPGIDVRADGGYVVAPPTLGSSGKLYEWDENWLMPSGFQDLPDKLLKALQEKGQKRTLSDDDLFTLLEPKGDGERHEAMTKLVGHYANHFGRGEVWGIISLWNAKNDPPINEDEFQRQFDDQWSRWGNDEREEMIEDMLEHVRNAMAEGAEPKLLLMAGLEGRRLSKVDYMRYREICRDEFGFAKGNFDTLVTKIGKGEPEKAESVEDMVIEVTGERKDAAIMLAQQPSLLYDVLRMVKRFGLVGEETNALIVYLGATSRVLDDPINIMLQGESSSGKSASIATTLNLIPEEQKIVRIGYSPMAVIYSPVSFKHKVICILELSGAEAAGYNIRNMQSEKKIEWEVTVARPDGSGHTTETIVKEGPAAWITSTVKLTHDTQNESRNWPISPDSSPKQTKEVTYSQTIKPEDIPEEDLLPFLDMQRLLSGAGIPVAWPTDIHLAILDSIHKNHTDLKATFRRDNVRIREMMRASAFIHQYQRPIVDGMIIPDIRDYYMLWRIGKEAFKQGIDPVLNDKRIRDVVATVWTLYEQQGDAVSRGDIVAYMRSPTGGAYANAATTVDSWIQKAVSAGALENARWGNYKPVGENPKDHALMDFELLPDPRDVLKALLKTHPEWHGLTFIDPLNGAKGRID